MKNFLNASRHLSSLCLLICLSFMGCTQILPILADQNPCTTDLECPADELCVFGGCMAHEQPTSTVLAFEIRPPEDSGFQNQQILNFEPATQNRFTLTLEESVEMKGILHKHDGTALSARIIANPTSGITGRNLVVTTTTDSQGYFQLHLIKDTTYRWSIFPDDNSYAPLFLSEILAEAQEDWGEPILLPEPDNLRQITGSLTATLQPGTALQPIAGLQVRLFSDDKMVSSASQSDENGAFEIRVTDGEFEHVELEIVPVEDNPRWPTLRINDFSLEQNVDLGDIDLGSWPSENTIRLRVTDASGEPVSSAKIYAASDMGKGQIRFLEATNEEGELITDWPNNAFELGVVAPPSSSAGFTVLSGVVFSEIENELTVNLPTRQAIEGIVWSPSGPPVSGATLLFSRMGNVNENNSRAIEKASWAFEALTDTDGKYGLLLDPGLYEVSVTPPIGSTLPVLVQKIQVLDTLNELDFVFVDPLIISGKIISPLDSMPVENVVIRAFTPSEPQENSNIPQEYQWLGDALSDKTGNFDIVMNGENSY